MLFKPLSQWYSYLQQPMQTEVEVTNRFSGLSLIDTVPEDLRTEAPDTVQEEMIKTIPKKKEMQKGKMVVWGGLKNI